MSTFRTEDLAGFTGSTQWFRHGFNRAVHYTEGVQFLAERGGAYWLIDAIASHLASEAFRKAAAQDGRVRLMHFWKLAVKPDRSALLSAIPDSGEPEFIQQAIEYTDFPLERIDIWAKHDAGQWTLLLPSEY